MSDGVTSSEARLLVLEMAVAALVAQLPQPSRDEVVGMLAFVAGVPEDSEEVLDPVAEQHLTHVRYWANEMLSRAMVSRKPSRPETLDPAEAERRRFVTR